MKKFLSLVLALIMTMSLVTISAGATEYADFADVDDIQYEEAVTVLNKIGIITGDNNGAFRPKDNLTRGAAAKIIVGLLIGPEAAANLVVTSAPYPDVPVTNTYAAVISYCKTAGIIDGYTDGTFKPGNSLTGYAFAKMLLGALGYDGNIEHFSGTGWTMRVAAIGQEASLFDRLKFNGSETVNREVACQLALNTLKGTMVVYNGGFTVNAGDATVVGAQTRDYKLSNQEYASHINNRKAAGTWNNNPNNAGNDTYTVEFGEEHFVDLRMNPEGTARDTFGRPSTEWSWKMVTFGTFSLDPDFVFTEKLVYRDDDTAAAAKRALNMNSFKTHKDFGTVTRAAVDTKVYVNGVNVYDGNKAGGSYNLNNWAEANGFDFNADANSPFAIEDIAAFTDNGTLVEAYIDLDDTDLIGTVVVIKSQLDAVKKIGSDYVSLEKWHDNDGHDAATAFTSVSTFGNTAKSMNMARHYGYNQPVLDVPVDDVEVEDTGYALLSGLKAGDRVVVVPVADDMNGPWSVGDVYVPETVSGALSWVDTYAQKTDKSGDRVVTALTVGGTKYNAALWNYKIYNIDANKINITKKDVTLTLDAYGNALLAEDVGSVDDYIVISNFYTDNINRRNVTVVEGFDMKGQKVELNLGATPGIANGLKAGDLVHYTNSPNVGTISSTADWVIEPQTAVDSNNSHIFSVNTAVGGALKKYLTRVSLIDQGGLGKHDYVDYASDVKFVYVNFNADASEVESVQVVTGGQDVTLDELKATGAVKGVGGSNYGAQAYTNSGETAVKAVVIKGSGVLSSNVLYVRERVGAEGSVNGKRIYKYKVARVNGTEFDDNVEIYSDQDLRNGDFATWSESSLEGVDGTFYTLRRLNSTGVATSAATASIYRFMSTNGALARVSNYLVNNSITSSNLSGVSLGDDINLQYAFITDDDDLWGNDKDTLNINTKNWVNMSGIRALDNVDANGLMKYLKEQNEKNGHTGTTDHARLSARISFVFNDKETDDAFRTTRMIVIDEVDTIENLKVCAHHYTEPADKRPVDGPMDIIVNKNNVEVGDADAETTIKKVRETKNGVEFDAEADGAPIGGGVFTDTDSNARGAAESPIALFDNPHASATAPTGARPIANGLEVVSDASDASGDDYILITKAAQDVDPTHCDILCNDLTKLSGKEIIKLINDNKDAGVYDANTNAGEEVTTDDATSTWLGTVDSSIYVGAFYVQAEDPDNEGKNMFEAFETYAEAYKATKDKTSQYYNETIYYAIADTDDGLAAAVAALTESDIAEAETAFKAIADDVTHPNEGGKLYVSTPIEEAIPAEFTIVLSKATIDDYTAKYGTIKSWIVVLKYA